MDDNTIWYILFAILFLIALIKSFVDTKKEDKHKAMESERKKTELTVNDSFAELLISQSAGCLQCGCRITFSEGASLAMDNGYSSKVMCKNCRAVFSVQLTPGGMTIWQ